LGVYADGVVLGFAMMSRPTKDDVARELAKWHFSVEPGLQAVFVLRTADGEPITLLEVNSATVATGSIEPFAFAPTKDTPYPTVVAEVTPEEMERVHRNEIRLPEGWTLVDAVSLTRSAA
jgi:hypothetical protein